MGEQINQGTAAIMQPYLFPYIGYFHLIEASDVFVFYDDVNYIKRGWINRNRILLEGAPSTFTVPITNASQNSLIKDTQTCIDDKWCKKFFGMVHHAYNKAPFYQDTLEILHMVLDHRNGPISDLAIISIVEVYKYLGEQFTFKKSSESSPDTRTLGRAQRLCEITQKIGYASYVNASGGKSLYNKPQFKELGIELSFVSSNDITYPQFEDDYVPWLSIIDVLMFNDREATKKLLTEFTVA